MNTIEAKIKELKAAAKANGLDVRFRNHRTEQGDFCIFIYDKTFRKTYAVGFDGNWKSDTTDFDSCLRQAYRWIERRDKRFEKVDGKWIYKGQ